MKKTVLQRNTFLFICSPSLGIIDSWLPELHKIREMDKNTSIVCVIPKFRSVKEIDPNKTLIRLSDDLFDKIIFKSSSGHWIVAESFAEAVRISDPNKAEKTIQKIAGRLSGSKLFWLPHRFSRMILNVISHLKRRSKIFHWRTDTENVRAILFDVYTEKKDQISEISEQFDHVPKYSISHGLKVKNINIWHGRKAPLKKNLIAYVHSEHEHAFIRDRFGVPVSNQRVTGVPRHQPDWIQYLIKKEKNYNDIPEDDFIFVISRPHTTDYHPRERMYKALQHVKKLAWQHLDKKIVVKLHPKEKVTGIYQEVFGENNYGSKWIYSNAHPFVLGDHCLFAIAFYSGVVVDMIALGVPTIELLDLRGLPKYDNEKSLRDDNGDPVFEYRYNLLTLGANEYDDLEKQANRILNDRDSVMKLLKENYARYYRRVENVNQKIAEEILKS